MVRRLTTSEFVSKAELIHGDLYDYSETNYVRSGDKVRIRCPIENHGIFMMTPDNHTHKTNPQGCPKCGREKADKSRKRTNSEFLEQVREIHGGLYDLSLVEYQGAREKVILKCSKHGEFSIIADAILSKGNGCTKCAHEKRAQARTFSVSKFLERAKSIHGDRYDYSEMRYVNTSTKIRILCDIHGPFYQPPSKHIHENSGCPRCADRWQNRQDKITTEKFIIRARKIHGDRFDYSKVVFNTSQDKVTIICPDHGPFDQIPYSHLQKRGCNACSGSRRRTTDEFISEAKEIHGDWYDYSLAKYETNSTPLTIICPDHGEFTQAPTTHINNRGGCTGCANYGFDMAAPAFLYMMRYFGPEERAIKIGITKDIEMRVAQLQNSLDQSDNHSFHTVRLLDSIQFRRGGEAKSMETEFESLTAHRLEIPLETRFSGFTEMYTDSIVNEWNQTFDSSVIIHDS